MCRIMNISSPMYLKLPNMSSKYTYVWTKCWCQFVWMFNYCKILTSWNNLGYSRSKYMNNPRWYTTIVLFMQHIFFRPLNQLRWVGLFQGLRILMRVPSINPMQPWNCVSCVAKTWCSSIVGHQISTAMAELMQDAIKMPSSFIAFLFQFHKNASYLVTLSCFIYNMKLSKHFSKVNLDGCLEMWCGSLVDLAWPMRVETTSCTNSSNLVKSKLVKDLDKLDVASMVVKMSRTHLC